MSVLIHLALCCSPFTQLNFISCELRPSLTEYVKYLNFSYSSVCYKISVVNVAIPCSVTCGLGWDVKYMLEATFLVLTQSFKIMLSLFPPLKEFKDENKTDVHTFPN